ncbi:MAG: anti-sigma factor family protein [Planctomycetota bacterium]|jgi:anti-sigma factor RsiW
MTEQNDPKFDCTDIKAMLSALIDDEAEASDRYRAERHLADCKACRELLSDAERNDALVATAVAGPQPGGLPAGFEAAVLRRVTEGDQPGAARRWSAWLGWFAAAAVILLGAALWWLDRPRVMNSPVATTGPSIRSTFFRPVVNEVAQYPADLPTGSVPQSAAPASSAVNAWRPKTPAPPALPALTRADAEALEGVSLLLAMLRQSDDDGFARVERAREVIEYDELLPRLSAARANLPAEDRPPVLAAEAMLYRVAHGPLSLADVREMRQAISRMGLPQQIDAISGRRPSETSL